MNFTKPALWVRFVLPLSIFLLFIMSTDVVHSQNTYCSSHSNAPWSEWIANVTLANLNNASEKTRSDRYATGYSDWTDKTATVSKGQSYPLSITPGLSWSGYQTNLFFRAWIDFNNNGIYEDTEKILEQNNGNQSVTQTITIPTTAITGSVRMRVSMKKDAYPIACETFAAGEVEDYMVNIQAGGVDPCATDVTPPVLTNCPVNISLTTSTTTAVANWTAPTATDNCGTPSVSSTYNAGVAFPIGSTTVIYTATDAKNNKATCSFTVTVTTAANPCATDVIPPVLSNCPTNINLTTTGTTATATWAAPTATDNCGTPSLSSNYTSGQSFSVGTTTVIYTATDAKNNTATCSFSIVVSYSNTATCKKYTASSTNSICNPATWQPYILRNSTDRYVADGLEFKETSTGTATLKGILRSPTWQAVAVDLTFSGKTTTGTPQKINCLTPSVSTANWAYYPTVSGTIALPSGTVNISTLSNALQIGTGANTQNINNLGGYTKFSIGTTPYELSFSMTNETTVACDNTTDPCLTDVTPPVFTNCPSNISLTTTTTTAVATWTAPTATDNCTTTPSVTSNFTSGQNFPIGSITVTYTAKDAKNNAATCSFNIIVTTSTTCTPSVPTKIYAKDITATTAKLVWSKVSNALEYEYQFLYDDTSQPTGGALISSAIVTDTFANIVLVQGRLRAIVRSRCTANGTWSAWSNATMFNLFNEPCTQGARTAFVEDFESGSYSTPQGFNLPVCWTKLTYHAPNVYESWVDVRITSRGTVGNTTKRAIMFRSTPLDSSLILMISPEIANLSAATNQLRFKAANTWGSELAGAGRVQIGTMSNIYDGSTFVPFGNPTVIMDNNFREYIIDFTTYTGSNRFIAFKYLDAGGDQFRSLEIDDVVWETKPVTTASADIELTIASTPATYRQWTTNTVRVTAKNMGTTTMTNIKIDLKRPVKMSFGGTRIPSVGTFNDYCAGGIECSEWLIPSLAAGATATLDAPFFVLDAIAPIVVTTNLLASTPTDANVANNTASVTLSPAPSASQSARYKPTQLIPVVIQTIAPNPTDGELRIQLESLDNREVTFEFYNSLGKVVKSEKKAVEKGLNRLEFSIYDFEQGLYFVTPSTSQGHKVPTKFVKL